MPFRLLNRRVLTAAALLVFAATGTALTARAQGQGAAPGGQGRFQLPQDRFNAGLPNEVSGEVVVRFAPGVDAQAFAAGQGLEVKEKLRFAPDTFVLKGVVGDPNAAAGVLQNAPGVLLANANVVYRLHSLPTVTPPNDSLRRQQNGLNVLGATDLWSVTIGERLNAGPIRQAMVAVIDTAFDTSHPDLAEVMDPNGFDFSLDAPYNNAAASPVMNLRSQGGDHGQAMAGCVATATNNGQGLSSLAREGVRILPLRVADLLFDMNGAIVGFQLTSSNIVDAIYYALQQGADVISMSLGIAPSFFNRNPNDPIFRQALQDCYSNGIVLCASSGNGRQSFFNSGVNFPALMPEVIAVGAVGPFGELADYSDGGPDLEIMCPGGNDSSGFAPDRQILSTTGPSFISVFNGVGLTNVPSGYEFGQGTSPACAFAAGAIATLITQGVRDESLAPTEQVERIRLILRRTATPPIGGRRTNDFGFGIINPAAALREFTSYADVISPTAGEITASFAEPIRAQIVRPILERVAPDPADPNPIDFADALPLGNYVRRFAGVGAGDFTLSQNGTDVTAGVEILDSALGLIEYEPDSNTRYSIGNNALDITFTLAQNTALTRSLVGGPVLNAQGREIAGARAYPFRVQPRVELPGLRMISLPFQLQPGADTLNFLYGGNLVRLARFIPETGGYALFDAVGSPQDDGASLTSVSAGVAKPPIGMAFWARVVNPTQTQILGRSERAAFYRIPIKPGFNMIGNPYSFRVPFQVCLFQVGQEVITATEAVQRNFIRPTLWRYEDGRYSFKVLPQGELVEFEGHWIRAFREMEMIVPRVPSVPGVAAAAARPVNPLGAGWVSTFKAEVAGKTVAEVTLGRRQGALDGYGPEDVENPPVVPGASGDLRIRHRDWGRFSGAFAQDLRSWTSRPAKWTVEVETSESAPGVKLAWDRIPAGANAFMQVDGDPQRISLSTGVGTALSLPAGRHRITITSLSAGK